MTGVEIRVLTGRTPCTPSQEEVVGTHVHGKTKPFRRAAAEPQVATRRIARNSGKPEVSPFLPVGVISVSRLHDQVFFRGVRLSCDSPVQH